MIEEETQKTIQVWEELKESILRIVEEIAKVVVPIIKRIVIAFSKIISKKKACKCLHILRNTKNKRIKNKQIKRIEGMLTNYMAL